MTELPISSPYRSTPQLPVTDAEREQLSARLNTAFTQGDLDSDDYRGRLDQLFAAERLGQLVPVVDGLPPAQTYESPAIVASSGGQPGELAEPRNGRPFALMLLAGIVGLVLLIVILLIIIF